MPPPSDASTQFESVFVVTFLRSTADTEVQRTNEHQAKVDKVSKFLDCQTEYVKSLKRLPLREFRSGADRLSQQKDNNLTSYEVPFVEVTFELECALETRHALPYLYRAWCRNPPIEAWIGRGPDVPLFDGEAQWLTKRVVTIDKAQFGIIDGLLTFCPEVTIKDKGDTHSFVKLKASDSP